MKAEATAAPGKKPRRRTRAAASDIAASQSSNPADVHAQTALPEGEALPEQALPAEEAMAKQAALRKESLASSDRDKRRAARNANPPVKHEQGWYLCFACAIKAKWLAQC